MSGRILLGVILLCDLFIFASALIYIGVFLISRI